jgi:membrane protease YdiL (CAAX protease family)
MNAKSTALAKVLIGAIPVLVPLIAAAWLIPPGFPLLLRQILLCVWGVGAILVAERWLFSPTWSKAMAALGFVPAHMRTVIVSLLVSVPMWIFLPLFGRLNGVPVRLQPQWLAILLGVVLVNGITEEVIHRGFIFGNLRREHSFAQAVTISALVFAAQHLYLIFSIGWAAGLSSVLLAALLSFPLAYLFEQGGNSIGGPGIIHTSSNAPVLIFVLPQSFVTTALIPHMAVVLLSLYLVFAFRKFLVGHLQSATTVYSSADG